MLTLSIVALVLVLAAFWFGLAVGFCMSRGLAPWSMFVGNKKDKPKKIQQSNPGGQRYHNPAGATGFIRKAGQFMRRIRPKGAKNG